LAASGRPLEETAHRHRCGASLRGRDDPARARRIEPGGRARVSAPRPGGVPRAASATGRI